MNHDILDLEALNIPYLETTKFGDYTIKIVNDDDYESPRDWEPLGTMVCWAGSRYSDYGDTHGYDTPQVFIHQISGLYPDFATEELTAKQFERCETVANANNIILPLFKYEHSGVAISTTPFSCPYDSGQAGYIFVSKEDIRKEFSVKSVSQKRHKEVIQYLKNEVKVYNQYLNGEVFYFSIDKADGDETTSVDACGGYFGYDEAYMIECIKDAIRFDIRYTPQQTEMF